MKVTHVQCHQPFGFHGCWGRVVHALENQIRDTICYAEEKVARHRVLLVEDHAGFAEATAALMRLHGLDVWIATSGGDALKLAEECNPVLVLCDLALPDMTGLDVLQALRARRGANDCLTVILSAMSATHLREMEDHPRISDVTLLLPKPLTSPIVIDLIGRLEALRPPAGSA
jgi:CheY-like chemotaxis protein